MDQMFDIYVNVEGPSVSHSKWTRNINSSEHFYEDEDMIHTLEPNRTGPALSAAGGVKKSSFRAAAVLLGLLCLLLLAGLISLVFLYTKGKTEGKMQMVQLHNSYNNLTEELGQLQTSYNNLDEELGQLKKTVEELSKQTNLNGWVNFNSSFYYISSCKNSWQRSRDDCLQRGADLMVINSKEEQEFPKQYEKEMWIGLTYKKTEGAWNWVDGTPVTTWFWLPGEPNNYGRGEDCVEIRSYQDGNSWNNQRCESKNFWICEKKMAP